MSESVKVLHLISSLKTGGAEKLLIDLLKHSRKLNTGIEFEVVVMNDRVDQNLKSELLKVCPNAVFFNRKEGYKHPKYFFYLLNIIRQRKVKIIHTHNFGGKIWAMLCKLAMPWLKIIHTLHSVELFDKSGKLEIFMHKKLVNMNIAISDTVRQYAASKGVTTSTLIYNGIDVQKFASHRKQRTPGSIFSIVNVARITHQQKGQDILVKAIAECKSKGLKLKCSFIGGIYENDKGSLDYLKNLAKGLKLEEVEFLGMKSNIHELLPDYDLFVLPSRSEGLGLVLLEAMAAGLPVIANNVFGPKELIQHGENGLLFETNNHLDLASKIMEFYNDRKRMYNIAERGSNYANKFDILVMCENYHKLYKTLVKGK